MHYRRIQSWPHRWFSLGGFCVLLFAWLVCVTPAQADLAPRLTTSQGVRHALKHSPGRYLFAGAVLSCAAVTFLWWFARQKNSRNTAITTGIIAGLIGGAVLVQIWADRFTLPQRHLPPGPPRLDSTPPPVNEAAPEAEPSP